MPNAIWWFCGHFMTINTRYLPVYVAILMFFAGQSSIGAEMHPLLTVKALDFSRYLGKWHEISKYPNKFQRKCIRDTSAEYSLGDQGEVIVRNRCTTADGTVEAVTGAARRVAPEDPTRLKVRFAPSWLSWLPLVWGDYWVIGLAPDYRYAVVGEPSRQYLWILARNTRLSQDDRTAIDSQLGAAGYEPQRLVETPQSGNHQ